MTAERTTPSLDTNTAVEGMVASSTTLFAYLTTAMALSRGPALVRSVRASANLGERGILSFGPHGPFLHVDGDVVVGSSVDPPGPTGPGGNDGVVDLRDLFANDDTLSEELARTYERTGILPEVAGWLQSFASGGDAMPREMFRAIAAWQPLVAVEAYRQLTYAGAALDGERRGLLDAAARGDASPQELLSYWTLVHMISNAALLATMGEERDWLADLASNVPAGGWTPSFILVRERCFRLALRAGWAAASFGDAAVPRYLGVLAQAVAPLRAFDAVLGLTAIGIRHPELGATIGRELRTALASAEARAVPDHRFLYEAMARSADLALSAPSRAARLTRERATRLERRSARRNGEAVSTADGTGDEDCAELEQGLFPCLVALAVVVPAPAEALFPPAAQLSRLATRHLDVHGRAHAVLLRTGLGPADEPRGRWSN